MQADLMMVCPQGYHLLSPTKLGLGRGMAQFSTDQPNLHLHDLKVLLHWMYASCRMAVLSIPHDWSAFLTPETIAHLSSDSKEKLKKNGSYASLTAGHWSIKMPERRIVPFGFTYDASLGASSSNGPCIKSNIGLLVTCRMTSRSDAMRKHVERSHVQHKKIAYRGALAVRTLGFIHYTPAGCWRRICQRSQQCAAAWPRPAAQPRSKRQRTAPLGSGRPQH